MRSSRWIGLSFLVLLCLGLTLGLWRRAADSRGVPGASQAPEVVILMPVEVIEVGEAPARRQIQIAR